MTQRSICSSFTLLAALVSAFSSGTPAASADDVKPKPLPPGVEACDIDALANDQTPEGLNIRADPNASSAILGRLRIIENPYKEKIAADVHVIGVKNGWFLIEGAVYGDYDLPKKIPQLYSGRGWVSGKLLTTGLRTSTLKTAPDESAPDVAELLGATNEGSSFGPDTITVTAMLDCKGKWFRVEAPVSTQNYSLKPKLPSDGPKGTIRGWTIGSCTNQRTTCV